MWYTAYMVTPPKKCTEYKCNGVKCNCQQQAKIFTMYYYWQCMMLLQSYAKTAHYFILEAKEGNTGWQDLATVENMLN